MAADLWGRGGGDGTDQGPGLDRPRAVDRPRGPEPLVGEGLSRRPEPRIREAEPARLGTDGSWEWRGRRLERGENEIGDRGLDRRREIEPAVTRDMQSIAAGLPHARLEGCPDHTLKGADRFKGKLATEIADRPHRPVTQVERNIPDGIRYTFSIDDTHYTEGVTQAHEQLLALGYELRMQKNMWDDASYKGINSRWVEPNGGEMIEVQFHTPTSWAVNKTTHDAYEELADPATHSDRRQTLQAWREHQSATISVPPGAGEIPDYRREQP